MTSRRVRRRPAALADLESCSDYLLGEAGVPTALRFLDCVEAALEMLVAMPRMGARREWLDFRLPELRLWPVPQFPAYLIPYVPVEGGVELVRVLHARRDIQSVFEEE